MTVSGGLDPSISLKAGQGVTPLQNPLQTVGTFANVQNALNQNQLGKLAIQKAQLEQGLQRQAAFNSAIAPLIRLGDKATQQDVLSSVASLRSYGIPVDGIMKDIGDTMPLMDPAQSNNPAATAAYGKALQGWILSHAARNWGPEVQAQAFRPNVNMVDTGGQIQGVDMNAYTNPELRNGITLNRTITPQEAATPRTTTDAAGNPVTAPSYMTTPPALLPPQLRGGSASSGIPGDGRYHPPGQGSPQTVGSSAAAPAVAGGAPSPAQPAIPGAGGTAFTPPGPGSDEDVKMFKTAQAAVPASQTAVQSLEKAQHALELANTGRSTGSVHAIKAFLNAQGFKVPDLTDDDSVANYDIAHKYLLDYARQQGAAAHSDLQLQTAEGSNASTDINQAAALQVVKTNIGRERQKIAQVMTMQNPSGIGYGAHVTQFANQTDPRGFAWDAYTPQERANIVAQAKKDGTINRLYRSLETAARLHLIEVPQAQQQQASAAPTPAPSGPSVPVQ
jgi:hypothetical protein